MIGIAMFISFIIGSVFGFFVGFTPTAARERAHRRSGIEPIPRPYSPPPPPPEIR